MFARFDENPAMTLRVIKETKRYGRTDARTDTRTHGRTDGQRENSIPPTNKVCGGYNYLEGMVEMMDPKKTSQFWRVVNNVRKTKYKTVVQPIKRNNVR